MKHTFIIFSLIIFSFIILLILFISGCSLFDTRTPEPPTQNGGTFIPPTSPDIVIDNFIDCIRNKNVDNYIACFDSAYVFVASGNAITMFPSFFDNWKVSNERRYFLALTTTLGQSNSFNINLFNKNFEIMTADSVVLVADYNIYMDWYNVNYPSEYEGKLLFTIVPTQNGLWGISRWQDFQFNNADSKEPISFLKAYFHN